MPGKITVEADAGDTQLGFPKPKAGRIPCLIGTPKEHKNDEGSPMLIFPLKPLQNIPCVVTTPEGEKEIMDGQGKEVLAYVASLKPGALKFGSVAKIENAARMPKAIHNGKEINLDILPQFAGKQVLAVVTNVTENGELKSRVSELFPM